MSDLDTTKSNPAFSAQTRTLKDALGNARLSRSRETQGPPSPDSQEIAQWDLLQIPPG